MKALRFSLLLALAGCLPGTFPSDPPDVDGDGYTEGDGDCDDNNAAVNPTTVWFEDADGDAYGDAANSVAQCDAPAGFVLSDADCDDANPDIRPAAVETCDGEDEDCDGVADDGAPGSDKYYTDLDADGYGDGATLQTSCVVLSGRVTKGGDCDDEDKESFPGADEVCDKADNDCNTLVDDEPSDGTAWFVDADDDGFGSTESEVFCADPGTGYSATDDDCDDADKLVGDFVVWYGDVDKDGYGDDAAVTKACDLPVDHVDKGGDCKDTDKTINPAAAEVCDGVDQDCDTQIDDSPVDPTSWYLDTDEDTYGTGVKVDACTAPTNKHVDRDGDCNDADAAYNPEAAEECTDTEDFNCDGSIGFVDADDDGFASCKECNDADKDINPAATEICDAANVDENCSGTADDLDSGVSDATRKDWYLDGDADTYGLTTTVQRACDRPSGYVATSGDCDDALTNVNPGAPEACDAANLDEDCDGLADDLDSSASGRTSFYADDDGDSHGDLTDVLNLCDAKAGRVASSDDCDDTKSDIHPGATEICDVGDVDEDCDNLKDDADPGVSDATRTDWYFDGDDDNYGLTSQDTRACDSPTDYVALSGDCNDTLGTINPGVPEVCDVLNVDEDCDGAADNLDTAPTGTTLFYADKDGDTHGDPTDSKGLCDLSAGRVASNDDCDDADINTYPGAPEVCDGAANDCGTGWLLADEADVVTHFPTTGAASDLSAAWAAGAASDIEPITLPASGTVSVCAGTYYVAVSASSGTVSLSGAGASTVFLDGDGGTTRVLTVANGATVDVSDVTLRNGAGGALVQGDAIFTDVQIVDNAATLGGGARIDATGTALFDTCLVSNNTASTDGGGLWSAGVVDLDETIVSFNTATVNGGGAFLEDSGLTCTSVTVGGLFENDAASGGAVYGRSTNFAVDSVGCDWGVPTVDDNAPDDIVKEGTGVIGTYGANATFACSGTTCVP